MFVLWIFQLHPAFIIHCIFLICFFSFGELDKELGTLKMGLKDIDKEMKFFESTMPHYGDRFVTVMNQFATVASYNFSEVEEDYTDMKLKVGRWGVNRSRA